MNFILSSSTSTHKVYRLVSGGTIEERMIEHAQKKLYLDKMVNSGSVDNDDSNDQKGGLSANELISSIKFGCNAVFGDPSLNDLPKEEDIEFITDCSRTEDYSAGKLKGGVSQSTEDFDTGVELKPSTQFGGTDFTAVRVDCILLLFIAIIIRIKHNVYSIVCIKEATIILLLVRNCATV